MNRRLVVLAAVVGGAAAAAVVIVARRRAHRERARERHTDETVTIASEDSFPASDPPARTVTTGSMV
jgi:hypothetical protein